MFKNLSTSTKLIILCGMFILSISVTTASLVAEHRIAIDFARKELLGDQYLEVLRNTYAAILSDRPIDSITASPRNDRRSASRDVMNRSNCPSVKPSEDESPAARSTRVPPSTTSKKPCRSRRGAAPPSGSMAMEP